jgi:hypothetical protein
VVPAVCGAGGVIGGVGAEGVGVAVVAGEPEADVEPGLGGVGRVRFFCWSSGEVPLLLLSLPSEDDIANHQSTWGCTRSRTHQRP